MKHPNVARITDPYTCSDKNLVCISVTAGFKFQSGLEGVCAVDLDLAAGEYRDVITKNLNPDLVDKWFIYHYETGKILVNSLNVNDGAPKEV
jgi:hypothetical protein